MKAAFLAGIGRFDIRQARQPEIANDTDVLVRIRTVGVCGSDVHYFTRGRIGSQVVRFPFILGHEAAGVVESIATRVTGVKPGQRIAIDPAVSCGQCDQCKAGREHTCRTLHFMGSPFQREGCLREYAVIPEQCCYPIPDEMTLEQATLSEPLAIALYAVDRSPLAAKANVAVIGVGPIGMCVFHTLRTKSVGSVYVTDKREERLTMARQLHPAWSGNPERVDVSGEIERHEPLLLDIVYECSGDPVAISQSIAVLKPGGSLVLIGIPETDEISFPIHELRRKEITVINIRRQVHCTQKAIDLLGLRRITLDALVTHRFPLEKTAEAFELVTNYRDGVMKAMITID
jgi:L-iditol 2-dehydrogenase